MNIVGIHDGHNSSVTIVQNGKVLAACQEERLTRVKNQGGSPVNALHESLRISGLGTLDSIDQFVIAGRVSQPPYITRQDVLDDYAYKSMYSKSAMGALRSVVSDNDFIRNLWLRLQKHQTSSAQRMRSSFLIDEGVPFEKVQFIDHHTAHASSAYYGMANYDERILVLTNDGAGDGLCGTVSIGYEGQLQRIGQISEDNSLATIFAMITYMMGMVPLEHEYKIMGLAPYYRGDVKNNKVYQGLVNIFEWDQETPFLWRRSDHIPRVGYLWKYLENLLHNQRFDSVAASMQAYTEMFMVEWVKRCIRETGVTRVAVAGGTFMNVKANQALLDIPDVEELFVFPSCGDETNSVGAAYWSYAHSQLSDHKTVNIHKLGSIYWGGEFSDHEIENVLENFKFNSKEVTYKKLDNIESIVAELLSTDKVVARFKGRMEFGARALGNRSILAKPSDLQVVQYINDLIKSRDFWMPFAPAVLAEYSDDYFRKNKPISASYMVMSFDTKKSKRGDIIASLHPQDGTARPQEVYSDMNSDFASLLQEYRSITGEAVLLNTSFNLHGYPLVYSPLDALNVFNRSGLEYMALGNYLVSKCEK